MTEQEESFLEKWGLGSPTKEELKSLYKHGKYYVPFLKFADHVIDEERRSEIKNKKYYIALGAATDIVKLSIASMFPYAPKAAAVTYTTVCILDHMAHAIE